MYTSCKNVNPEYDWPEFWDLKTALITCIIWFISRGFIIKAFTHEFYKRLKPKFTGKEREERAKRAAQWAMKGLYYSVVVSIGYTAIKEGSFYPSVMGGHGDASRIFEEYPYMN